MEPTQELIIVSAPNKAGEAFIRQLIHHELPFAAIANNRAEKERLAEIGVRVIIVVDTAEPLKWSVPTLSIRNVFLFENSFNLCCRYIQLCRRWTVNPIYVITHTNHPRLVYRGLGANYVIHTNSDEIPFLIQSLVG